ncbi:hypothetical protein SAMN05421688_2305 [Poseidonocella pacifica]|uniref:Lipoprotein n=1 Tax=Poseidonocella pacifica TaxID=871651 RepID=A0A1I0XI67_9RHOB|nr:hypothetical protein [Poseidonocella pacifica]SFB00614.1 hypothetical protein SAMN05421688_2305 [Poseidonocella pacifica]
MWKFALPAVLIIAGCASPQQQCVSRANKDLRVIDRLIAEKQEIVTRGYAVVTETETRTRFERCRDEDGDARLCRVERDFERTRPVAVNLEEQRDILRQLRAKRAQLADEAQSRIAACRTAYPEG